MKNLKYRTIVFLCFSFLASCVRAANMSVDTTRAIVYGVSKYKDNENIKDLEFADDDALAFVQFLKSEPGGSLTDDQIMLRTNEDANKLQLSFDLAKLVKSSRKGDRAIIYFSGHGDVNNEVKPPPGFLLCHDALVGHYEASGGYKLEDLENKLNIISDTVEVFLFIDACRAGKAGEHANKGSQAATAIMESSFKKYSKILSCRSDQLSQEGKTWGGGRGAFSYHLINGLYGLADGHNDKNGEGDYEVTFEELRNYVEASVKKDHLKQQPVFDVDNDYPIADVYPDLKDSLIANQNNTLVFFSARGKKGFVDRQLDKLDSATMEVYYEFEKALSGQRFFSPKLDCAEHYYQILLAHPKITSLKETLANEYAFALLDRCQNFLYDILESKLSAEQLNYKDKPENYEVYSKLITRAIEILGEDHEMYETNMARKYYFLAKSKKTKSEKKLELQKALTYQKDMAHVYLEFISACEQTESEVAEEYSQKALDLIPSWDMPYLKLYTYYVPFNKEKASYNLNVIKERGTNTSRFWWAQANFLKEQGDYANALKYFEVVQDLIDTPEDSLGIIVDPLALTNEIANANYHLQNYQKAIEVFYINSVGSPKSSITWKYLSRSYYTNEKYEQAISAAKKAIAIAKYDQAANELLAKIYNKLGNTTQEQKYLNLASTKGFFVDDWRFDK